MSATAVTKGRPVSGPRTKLASAAEVREIRNAVIDLAESVAIMAKAFRKGAIHRDDGSMLAPPVDDENPDDENRDEPPMDLADDFDSDFNPYGEEDDAGGAANEDDADGTEQELGIHEGDLTKAERIVRRSRLNRARLNRARLNRARLNRARLNRARRTLSRARIRKDDASSNFGEKDSDVPGNKPADLDNKHLPAEDYLIQGGPEDGPGPVKKAVRREVYAALADMGLVRKSTSAPRIPASTVTKSPTEDELYTHAIKNMSFADLNRARVRAGQLPAGIF